MSTEVEEPVVRKQDLSGSARLRNWQRKLTARFGLDRVPVVRKVVIGILGFTVLVVGVAMMVLPGPAFIVIPVGLAILATEFAWASRILRRGSVFVARARRRHFGRKKKA